MEYILTSIRLISPLILLMVFGYFLNKINILDDRSSTQISKLVLKVLLPINIFINIYRSDFITAFNSRLIVFILLCNFVGLFIMNIIAHKLTSDRRQLGVIIQDGIRGNYSILGLPLAISVYGSEMAVYMSIVIAFLTPLYNIISIMLFEHYDNLKSSFAKQLFNVFKSPLTLGSVLGVVLNLCNVVIPSFLLETLNYISVSLTAISLLNLGSTFNFKLNKNVIKPLIVILIFKMFLFPAIVIVSTSLMGFRNELLLSAAIVSAVPIAVSSYATAVCYNTDKDLANSAVVYSHVIGAISMPIMLSILMSLGLI